MLNFYAPARFYSPALYGWAMGPWGAPMDYMWDWSDDPWAVFYGPYFRPWGVYARPSLWLTDYLIANTLQMAFQARDEARAEAQAEPDADADAASAADDAAQAPAPLSDDVKQLFDAQVQRELSDDQADAGESRDPGDSVPPALTGNGLHLFLANDSLEVENTATGGTCVIGEGDAIQMDGALPRSGGDVNVLVRASRGSGCPVNSTVAVPLTDLVEMHNAMRETIDRGLDTLRERQGTNNLPLLPPAAAGEPIPTAFAASMRPDPDVVQVLEEESGNANQIEHEVLTDYHTATPASAGAAAIQVTTVAPKVDPQGQLLASIQAGQTEDQVIAILGQPVNTSFLGGVKKLYEYRAGKITFTDGEVSDVEASGPASAAPPPAASEDRAVRPVASPPGTAPAKPVTNGMTEDEVVAILGQPLQVSFQGGLTKTLPSTAAVKSSSPTAS